MSRRNVEKALLNQKPASSAAAANHQARQKKDTEQSIEYPEVPYTFSNGFTATSQNDIIEDWELEAVG